MRPWTWKIGRLGFAISSRVEVSGYTRLFWRFHWKKKDKKRVSGAEPRDDLPCTWCKQVQRTTVNEIWCEANPTGYLRRLCKECSESCAG